MLLQLNPALPLLTPKGIGEACFLIDNGREHHLQWVVFIDETGECWTFDNPDVRLQGNLTLGRSQPEPVWRDCWREKPTEERT
jgi:hypothetical protein